jgi:hypothetical protein
VTRRFGWILRILSDQQASSELHYAQFDEEKQSCFSRSFMRACKTVLLAPAFQQTRKLIVQYGLYRGCSSPFSRKLNKE